MAKYYLENMPQADEAMDRVLSWYNGDPVDRPPVRFSEHNGRHNIDLKSIIAQYDSTKDFWFDSDMQLKMFTDGIEGKRIYGETFPVYYPNLGPSLLASYYGVPLEYAEVTSWAKHTVDDFSEWDVDDLQLDRQCENWKKIDEMSLQALDASKDRFFVGYPDLHPGLDFIADFTGVENLCMALCEEPDKVKRILQKVCDDFFDVFYYYDRLLEGQPSVSWLGIPFEGTMHIPSSDFSAMLSTELFEEFALPITRRETDEFDYNIFHVDGPGLVRHIDKILEIDKIKAIQLVQGVGDDEPIMQWIPFIEKVVAKGKGVIVGLQKEELKDFAANISPKGLYITLAADNEEQEDIVRFLENWK